MIEITYFPLTKLALWDGNVRKTDIHAGIDELAASIVSHGLDAIEDTLESWTPEALAAAGAILCLDHRGALSVERGLVRKEDAHKLASQADTPAAGNPAGSSRPDGLSSRLVEDLTAQHSAAIGAELVARPDIALASIVHGLGLDVFYRSYSTESCLKLSATSPHLSSAMEL